MTGAAIDLAAQLLSAATAFGLMFGMLHVTVRYVLDTSRYLREEAEHERAGRVAAEAELEVARARIRELERGGLGGGKSGLADPLS